MRSRIVNFAPFFLFLALLSQVCYGAFTFTSPLLRQIYQRNVFNKGQFYILGPTTGVTAEARANPIATYSGTDTGFVSIPVVGSQVQGYLTAAAGWYSIEVRTYDVGHVLVDDVTLAKAGIGDNWVTGGQSNATNYYQPLVSTPPNDAVNSRGITSLLPWRVATDPQDTADNVFSSVWPALGDLLFASTTFPIGFVSTGLGNTQASDWLPGTANYNRIKAAFALFPKYGVRGFLWHQGENDAAFSTTQASYVASLTAIINQIRTDAGWQVPCGIADTVTHPNEATGAGTRAGQTQMAAYLDCFAGANTDTLDNTYRYDTVHFNTTTGRSAHAQLWHDAIMAQPFQQSSAPVAIDSADNKLCFFTGSWKCVTGS